MQEKEAKEKIFVKGFDNNQLSAQMREMMCRNLFVTLGAEGRDTVDVNLWQWNGFLGKECLVRFGNGSVKKYWLNQLYKKFGKDGVWNEDHQIKIFIQPFEAQTKLDKLKVWRTVLTVVGSYCETQGDPEGLKDFAKIWNFPQKLLYEGESAGKQTPAVVVDWDDRPGICIVYSDEIHYDVLCEKFPVAFFEKYCNRRQWEEYFAAEEAQDGPKMTELEDAVMNRFPWPIHFVKTTFEGSVHEFRKSKQDNEDGGKGGGKTDKGGGKSKGKNKGKGKGNKGGKGKGKSQSKDEEWRSRWFNEETLDEKQRREAYQQELHGGKKPEETTPATEKKDQKKRKSRKTHGGSTQEANKRTRTTSNILNLGVRTVRVGPSTANMKTEDMKDMGDKLVIPVARVVVGSARRHAMQSANLNMHISSGYHTQTQQLHTFIA